MALVTFTVPRHALPQGRRTLRNIHRQRPTEMVAVCESRVGMPKKLLVLALSLDLDVGGSTSAVACPP